MDKNIFEQIKGDLMHVGLFITVILATLMAAYLVNRFFKRLIRRSTSDLNNDPTNYQFLRHLINAMVYMTGFGVAIYSIPDLRALASTFLAGASILAVAVGFASQQALSNIISGVFIVIFKPFRVHDRLSIQQLRGVVEDITLRHTVIRDFENKRIIIPNTVIGNEIIINSDFAEDKICKFIDIGITYDSDIDKAKLIMFEEVVNHPLHIDPRSKEDLDKGVPEVIVRVIMLAESSVNLRAWAWADNSPDGFIMMCDLYESIKKRFDKEGVEIAYPHRTLIIKGKKEALESLDKQAGDSPQQ
jgi:small conductance mechanosensitive channel